MFCRELKYYLYNNGKETQTTGELNWLDYGARMYDDVIGRWTKPDPMGEKYYGTNSYTYCTDNPIIHIDPNGKRDSIIVKEKYSQNGQTGAHEMGHTLGAGHADKGIMTKDLTDPNRRSVPSQKTIDEIINDALRKQGLNL